MYCKAVLTSVRKDMNLLKEVILDERSWLRNYKFVKGGQLYG